MKELIKYITWLLLGFGYVTTFCLVMIWFSMTIAESTKGMLAIVKPLNLFKLGGLNGN